MTTVVTARRLIQNKAIVEHPIVTIEDGHITSIAGRASAASPAKSSATVLDFPEATLAPSYIDIHIHGSAGHDVMEGTPEALGTIQRFLAGRGVGAYFPTTVTSETDATLFALDRLAGEIERGGSPGGAVPLGIHLEGPFLSHAKRGVHTAALLRQPSTELFDRFWSASRGQIRLMTIAPELEDALELIAYASARGVICSLGHSNAHAAEAAAGFDAGARSATHTFNAMRALDHRDPGIAAYVLQNKQLFAELICDGIHVDPMMVWLYFQAKGPERAVLITDGMSAAGMPDGRYKLGELDVNVENGRCTLVGGSGDVLAGSVLTMDRAVCNLSKFTGAELPVSVGLATKNPALLTGIDKSWGALEEGRQANLNALSPSGELIQSFRAGQPVAG
jgi:N-acetylglucosamine-6-phosphate deacetylase